MNTFFGFQLLIVFTFTFSIQEFVKGCGSVTKHWVDRLLDKMTAGDHIKAVSQIRQVSDLYLICSTITRLTSIAPQVSNVFLTNSMLV